MTEHLVITSLPNIFKTLLFVCQFWSLALVAMVRQPKVLLMIIHSLLWLCSNISQRLFVCCIFECSDHLTSGGCIALQLDFIQCPFPNQIQFGLEKLHPKIAYNFPNQFQFGLERKKMILQDADSKPNSDWFGKF